jgi:hypothetical protein
MTAVDPGADPNAGDIRNAKVTFLNGGSGGMSIGCDNLSVGLVTNNDSKTGTVTCNWTADIGSLDSTQFTIGIKVTNYYRRASSLDDTVVTVSKPLDNFITGGGYLLMTSPTGSSGLAAGAADTKNHFGFSVRYNKQNTNLQGNINTIVRSALGPLSGCPAQPGGVYVYQVKGNSMTSLAANLGITNGHPYPTATFDGKASIQDITNEAAPCSVDGNATLQVTMTDKVGSGSTDTIGITVWNKAGGMWFSSKWSSTATVEQAIGGGNLVVR